MQYKVLITTSGVGERLGELTKYLNKALVRVGQKPALSYIIEAYPAHVPLVITVGYRAEQIKEFMALVYPERQVEYVAVDKYQGPGTSLGYSLLAAKDAVQCPFIYHACDTIVEGSILEPATNWLGGFKSADTTYYASWQERGGELIFSEKGADASDWLHIGLVGIKDYKVFWTALENLYATNPGNSTLNDCQTIQVMLAAKSPFKVVEFTVWFDTGNPRSLALARQQIRDHFDNLDKPTEAIYFIRGQVIKFFNDEAVVKERVARAQILAGLVPPITASSKNFYSYAYVDGQTYPRVVTAADFSQFLQWLEVNLWKPTAEVDSEKFKAVCYDFYHNKTAERIEKFLAQNNLKDIAQTINGQFVPPCQELLKQVNWDWLTTSQPSGFHGDLVLDNIIKTPTGYCLVDWRQNFGGLLKSGDKYYDLGKMYHNLVVNHDVINAGKFSVAVEGNNIRCAITRLPVLESCEKVLIGYVRAKNLDLKKISVIRALIWLSMSALHSVPAHFNEFLFYSGKLSLWQALQSGNSNI